MQRSLRLLNALRRGFWRCGRPDKQALPDFSESYSPAVYFDETIYGFSNRGMMCLDASDGTELWSESFMGSLIRVGLDLVAVNMMTGDVRVLRISRTGYEERMRYQAFERGTNTSPTFADGRIRTASAPPVRQTNGALLLLDAGPARNVLLIMASSEREVRSMVQLLASGAYRGGLVSPTLGLYDFG